MLNAVRLAIICVQKLKCLQRGTHLELCEELSQIYHKFPLLKVCGDLFGCRDGAACLWVTSSIGVTSSGGGKSLEISTLIV
jgi:hypothetical protein